MDKLKVIISKINYEVRYIKWFLSLKYVKSLNTRKIFREINDASIELKLNPKEMEGIWIALSVMINKGQKIENV